MSSCKTLFERPVAASNSRKLPLPVNVDGNAAFTVNRMWSTRSFDFYFDLIRQIYKFMSKEMCFVVYIISVWISYRFRKAITEYEFGLGSTKRGGNVSFHQRERVVLQFLRTCFYGNICAFMLKYSSIEVAKSACCCCCSKLAAVSAVVAKTNAARAVFLLPKTDSSKFCILPLNKARSKMKNTARTFRSLSVRRS